MENNEELRNVIENIKLLEQFLEIGSETSIEEVERQVKEHFAKCVNALAARQEVLLRDIQEKYGQQKDTRNELANAIDVRRKILETGKYVYNTDATTAENIWKGVRSLPHPLCKTLSVVLPNSIVDVIGSHGEVFLGCVSTKAKQFEIAGSLETFVGRYAKFEAPQGICWNPNEDCFYVCDHFGGAIKKLDLKGDLNTRNLVITPHSIAIHYATNTSFVSLANERCIAKIAQTVMLVNKGYCNTLGFFTRFVGPLNLAVDQTSGNLFVSDSGNNSVSKVSTEWGINTQLLAGYEKGFVDGKYEKAQFNSPAGILFDEVTQSLLVCDQGNERLRRVSLDGTVSTFCKIESPSHIAAAGNSFLVLSGGATPKLFNVSREGVIKEVQFASAKKCVFGRGAGLAVHEESQSCFITEPLANIITRIKFV
eukprot:Phypoly_transcript_08349.p1 GENE.Phypoly_transcript_08349~~Phypoly_transcript_08349.p1  ORF type:complete len:424 (+),score=45.81 Phypoly_transcript_08349:78-1349(+)